MIYHKRYENHDVNDITMNPEPSFHVLRMIMLVVVVMMVAMIRFGCVWIQQSICKGRIGTARNKGGRRPNVKTSCLWSSSWFVSDGFSSWTGDKIWTVPFWVSISPRKYKRQISNSGARSTSPLILRTLIPYFYSQRRNECCKKCDLKWKQKALWRLSEVEKQKRRQNICSSFPPPLSAAHNNNLQLNS